MGTVNLFDHFGFLPAVALAIFTMLFALSAGMILIAIFPNVEWQGMSGKDLSRGDRLGLAVAGVILLMVAFATQLKWIDCGTLFWRNGCAQPMPRPEPQPQPGPPPQPGPQPEDCRSGKADVSMGADQITATGRSHVILDGYTRLRGLHKSSNCQERYTVTWTPAPGHFLFRDVESADPAVVRFIGNREREWVTSEPGSGRFLRAVSVDAIAARSSSKPFSSVECGVDIKLNVRHLPEFCRAHLE